MTRRAYMIGTGIGNLAATVYLIYDGDWRGDQITILGPETHGANDGAAIEEFEGEYGRHPLGNSEGFLNQGGWMLNEETYENFWDMMGSVLPLDQSGKSVMQETFDFDHAHPIKDIGRLIDSEGLHVSGPKGYRHTQFTSKQRLLLTRLMMLPESRESELDDVSIRDWFAEAPDFSETNLWWMWQITSAFKDVSSVAELCRYMDRMILEFPHINILGGVTCIPYNQYESVILPLHTHPQGRGATFITNRKVTEFVSADIPLRDEIIIIGLRYEEVDNDDAEGLIEVRPEDLVFDTNDSITDSTSIEDLDTTTVEDHRYSSSALPWKQAAGRFYNLGHPDKFFSDRSQSEWINLTVTTSDHGLINEIFRLTRQLPGNVLNTFIDSTSLISLVVHHQPHYHAQTPEQGVFWGYALHPHHPGDFIDKPFIKMTGQEMLLKTIGHLGRISTTAHSITGRVDELMATAINVVSAHMPYTSALSNRHTTPDRPKVAPDGSKNLALVNQFVEMPSDMAFTEQYSVWRAQVAVYTLPGLDKPLTALHHYERNPRVPAKATRAMFC